MKKFLYVVLALIMIVGAFSLTGCKKQDVKYGKELIQNGSFEQSDTTTTYWYQSKEYSSAKDGVLSIVGYEDSDKSYLTVVNGSGTGNFVRVYQEVAVKRNGIYKITARIRNDELSIGANDNILGGGIEVLEGNTEVISTGSAVNGDWIEYTAYIKPKNTDIINVALTFGGDDAFTVGKVAFDDISMVRVKASEVPAGTSVINVNKIREKDYANSSTGGTLLVVFLSIITAAIIAGFFFAYRKFMTGSDKPLFKKVWITASVLVVAGVALRLVLAGTLFAASGTQNLADTAKSIVELGAGNAIFKFTNYSPLQIYWLWICGKLIGGWTSLGAVSVVIRLIPIICEGVTIALIYFFAKKYCNDRQAALYAGLYAALPIFFVLSSGYGIEVPVLTMLLFITFYALIEKDYVTMLASSLITVLWSPIGIYVLPFLVTYEIYVMAKYKDKKTILTFTIGWAVSFLLFILLSAGAVAPMFKAGHIMYIFKSYYLMLFGQQVCVSNAFNLYALFGLNGGGVNNAAFWLNIVFSLILVAYTVSLYFKNFNRAELTLIAGFFLSVMGVFSLNMNETALALGLILLLAYIIVTGEIRLFGVFGMLALLAFVNVGIIMNYSGALTDTFKYVYFNKGDIGYAVANVLSAVTVLFYGWTVYDITTNGKLKFIQPLSPKDTKPLAKSAAKK